MDLEHQLQNNSDKIQDQYASYVYNLCECLIDKGITVAQLRTRLSNQLSANHIKEADTPNKIFDIVSEYASFFHHHIFQSIQDEFCEASDCERRPQLKYSERFKNFINLHKISEFLDTNPQLKSKYTGSKELIFKIDDIQMSDKLVKVVDLKHDIANILKVKPSELQLVKIEDGCILVKFLISAAVADTILKLSACQEKEFQKLLILSLKCGSYELVFSNVNSGKNNTLILGKSSSAHFRVDPMSWDPIRAGLV